MKNFKLRNLKNVLLIGSELGKGGAERSISLLSYYLEKRGYNVILCILSGKDREQFYDTCEKVIFIDPPESKSYIKKLNGWNYRISKLKQIKKDNKIDVSISFLEGPDYANILSRSGEKIVLSIRGSKMFDKVISGWMGRFRKKVLIPNLYKRADEIVCVSNALSGELSTYFNIKEQKLRTIYNFYENERIIEKSMESLSEEERKIFSQPVIITSGRLHVSKAQDGLVRIMGMIKGKSPARLMILGDGELKNHLLELAKEKGLTVCDWSNNPTYTDADIYLMGYQHNAFKFYRHSSLFALSSSWEGFPNVFAEALICNIPVVSTDCYTGPREILNIEGLNGKPVETAHRVSIGSLLPMLDKVDEKRLATWADEVIYWLKQPKPDTKEFDKLTNRFTLDEMLKKWVAVIENTTA